MFAFFVDALLGDDLKDRVSILCLSLSVVHFGFHVGNFVRIFKSKGKSNTQSSRQLLKPEK